ncbi:hypothetical protein QTP88_008323 [Uroleucon formosanum]
MRCLQQQQQQQQWSWAGGGGGGGGVLPYIYLHEMSVGGRTVGAGRYVDERGLNTIILSSRWAATMNLTVA